MNDAYLYSMKLSPLFSIGSNPHERNDILIWSGIPFAPVAVRKYSLLLSFTVYLYACVQFIDYVLYFRLHYVRSFILHIHIVN